MGTTAGGRSHIYTRASVYLASGDLMSAMEANAGAVAFMAAVGVVAVAGKLPLDQVLGVANNSEPMAEWQR